MYENKVVNAGIWNSIGTFLLKGIVFLSVPIFSRLLSPADYGLVSTYSTYIAFLTVLVGLSLNTALTNARIDYAEDYEGYCNSIVSFSGLLFLLEFSILNLCILILKDSSGSSRFILNLILCASCVEFVIRTYYGINMVDYKYKSNLKISITNAVIGIIVSVFLINRMSNKVLARLVGQSLFLVFLMPFIFYRLSSGWKFRIKPEHIRYSIKIAVPNIFHQISQIIIGQSDRVMILKMIDAESAGKYSLVYTYSLVMQMIWNAVNDVWVPWLFRQLAVHDLAKVRRCSYLYMLFFSLVTAVAMLVSPDFLIYLAPESYHGAKSLIIPLILAAYCLFLYSFFVNLEFYYKKNSYIAAATALASTINIIGNLILLPIYGYEAAVFTTVLSYFFLMIFHAVLITYVFKIRIYLLRYFIGSLILISGIAFLAALFIDNILFRYLITCIILAGGGFICLKYKKELMEVFRIAERK